MIYVPSAYDLVDGNTDFYVNLSFTEEAAGKLTTSLIPKMTSNNTPSGVVTSSIPTITLETFESTHPWKAFADNLCINR